MNLDHDSLCAWANSTDFATGASDAGYTLVDGGSLPITVSSDYDYYITCMSIKPISVSDTFNYQLATYDSNKTRVSVITMAMGVATGASIAGYDQQIISLPAPIPVPSSVSYVGVEVDFGDTDALANVGLHYIRDKKDYL